VDIALTKLNEGGWVHLFSEGKVNQSHNYPQKNGVGHLPRFKWGIGRILMETTVLPTIIPMWLTGFDRLMPEGRSFPYNFIPRPGAKLSITFGDPIQAENIMTALGVISPKLSAAWSSNTMGTRRCEAGEHNILGSVTADSEPTCKCNTAQHNTGPQEIDEDIIRSELTGIIQRATETLGRKVSGDSLCD